MLLKEERQQTILNEIKQNGRVIVSELAEQFDVSKMTIRRDLKEIDLADVVKRTYGGAILSINDSNQKEPPTLIRVDVMKREKMRIAEIAAKMIGKNEMVFLGSGTTTLYVAQELKNRDDITVVSNALTILNYLGTHGKMPVIGIGGFLRREEFSLIGHFADKVISDLHMDKVIMGMRGIHPRLGLTSDHPQELLTDRTIMGISNNLILVADHTKIGHVASCRTAPVDRATTLITGVDAPPEILNAIRSQGVEVIII